MVVSIWRACFTMCPHSNFAHFRLLSFIGIVTTSITSAYMTTAALEHGQVLAYASYII